MVRPALKKPARSRSRSFKVRKSRSVISARVGEDGSVVPESIVSVLKTSVSVISSVEKKPKSSRHRNPESPKVESSDSEKTVYPGSSSDRSSSRSRSPVSSRRSRSMSRSPRLKSCLSNSPSRRRNPWRKARQQRKERRVSFAKNLTNSKTNSKSSSVAKIAKVKPKSPSSSSSSKSHRKNKSSRYGARNVKKGKPRSNRKLFK